MLSMIKNKQLEIKIYSYFDGLSKPKKLQGVKK
jgi:hypothetical protein